MQQYIPVDIVMVTEATYPYFIGGVSTVVHQIIESQSDLSFGVIYIAWDREEDLKLKYSILPQLKWIYVLYLSEWLDILPNAESINFDFINIKIRRQERFSLEFVRFIENSRANIYHSHTTGFAGFFAAIAATQNRSSFILTEHALYHQNELFSFNNYSQKYEGNYLNNYNMNLLHSSMRQMIYERCDISSYLYEDIALESVKLGSHANKIRIVPNGVSLAKFQQVRLAQVQRQFLRDQFINLQKLLQYHSTISNFKWQLTFIGRVVPVKGVLDLLETMAQLRSNGFQHFQLNIVGPVDVDPQYFKNCLKKIDYLKLNDFVAFHGEQDVSDFLKTADLLIMSSLSEVMPLVVLEGMACGLPIVGTHMGAMKQMIEEPIQQSNSENHIGPAGIIVPIQDAQAMATSILTILSQQTIYQEFSQNGPLRIRQSYEDFKVLGLYRNLYNSCFLSTYAVSNVY